jgi:hypothetical protein
MRLKRLAVLGILLLAGVAGGKEAAFNIVANGVPGYVPTGGAGFAFMVTNAATLTALGYHLDQQNGVFDQFVEVLDDQSNTLALALVSLTNAQVGQFWYQGLAGVPLPVNRTNYIVGYDPATYAQTTNKFWFGTTIVKDTPTTAWFDIAPEIKYLGPARATNITGPTSLMNYGVNFMFGPPRPPLYIESTPTNAMLLLWPTQAVGFFLQGTTNVATWPASNLQATVTVSGTNNVVTMPAEGPLRFFRLRY